MPVVNLPMSEDVSHRRPIRSFVRREGRFTAAQRRALDNLLPRYGVPAGDGVLDLDVLFGRTAERWLEIGFGNGETLASLAVAHPERDFLGLDVHRPGAGVLLQRLEAAGATNVRIVCEDAAAFLAQRIADESLDAVCVFFPDPWPKKRHHKRRLVQPEFMQRLRRKLKIGAMLYLATDWEEYAEHMRVVMEEAEGYANAAGSGFAARPPWRPLTRFEQRGARLGHTVRDLAFRRQF